MLPLFGIKSIAELISIHYHLQKLSDRNQLYITTLSSNHRLNNRKLSRVLSLTLPIVSTEYFFIMLIALIKTAKNVIVNISMKLSLTLLQTLFYSYRCL